MPQRQALRLLNEKIRLDRPHRLALDWSFGLLALTGLAWLVLHYGLAERFDEWPMPSWEGWSMKLHGLAAMASLFATGSLATNHIRRAWALRRNLATGLAVSALALSLALSGYGLYYFASEELQPLFSLAHWLLGLAAVVALPVHIVWGRARVRVARAA